MMSSNGNIFRVTGLCARNSSVIGAFPTQRPVTRSFDVSFDPHLNQQLSNQWRCWWFETPLRHCNVSDLADRSQQETQLVYLIIPCFLLWCRFLGHDVIFVAFLMSLWHILVPVDRTSLPVEHDKPGVITVYNTHLKPIGWIVCICIWILWQYVRYSNIRSSLIFEIYLKSRTSLFYFFWVTIKYRA